ncbi:MAG: NADH-quinone oxidoreductase subunit C [Gammaproteobacteria bacterium]|nr:NADH-quinone oxidoreductase subunit C [Gammaproteobacteria bacterium]MCW8987731.1 NADH-quinone oxidoreductase subunit C [Gammaproteobacteria bacterium]
MSDYYNKLADSLRNRFAGKYDECFVSTGQLNFVVKKQNLIEVCTALRDEAEYAFDEMIDLCGVDYSEYAGGNWEGERFAVTYQLLSVKNNHRLRVRVFVDGEPPQVASVTGIWKGANWFEREAFDLFGIIFDGHTDLRRILTDYGFVGHPFRKDFPLCGNVEMRYDEDKKRVIYQPVSIETRVNTPRIIRDDHRYADRMPEEDSSNA